MADEKRPDSGGARFIAERFIASMKELMDERFDETKRLRDVTIPDLVKEVKALQKDLANLQGRLAVAAAIISFLVSGVVAFLVKVLVK